MFSCFLMIEVPSNRYKNQDQTRICVAIVAFSITMYIQCMYCFSQLVQYRSLYKIQVALSEICDTPSMIIRHQHNFISVAISPRHVCEFAYSLYSSLCRVINHLHVLYKGLHKLETGKIIPF